MKKMLALLLALLMALNLCAAVAEEIEEIEKITIPYDDVLEFEMLFPDGYDFDTEFYENVLILSIESADAAKPLFTMTVAPDEEYSELDRLNDLSDADYESYVQSLLQDYASPTWETFTTSYGSKTVFINDDNTESDVAVLVGIYLGYSMALYIEYADGREVDAQAIETAVQIYSDMDFVFAQDAE